MFITITAKQQDNQLEHLGISTKEEDYFWTDTGIRTEDISTFYSRTPSTTIIEFYEDKPKMLVKLPYKTLFDTLNRLDYEVSSEE